MGVFVASTLALLVGCDESQVVHEPSFSLERMQEQPRLDPFDPSMSGPPAFAIARGFGAPLPRPVVTRALVLRGRTHFETICAACHGILGDGTSAVAPKMQLRRPENLLDPDARAYPPGRVFQAIRQGYGLMPSYAVQLSERESWGVVAYLHALQVARGTRVADLSPDDRAQLDREAR